MIKHLSTGIAVLALALSGVALLSPSSTVVETVREVQTGAVSSPDIQSPYISFGGVRQWAQRAPLATGTTTICAIQAPQTGSTTLKHAGVSFGTASSTASRVSFYKSTSRYTQTTTLAQGNQAAGGMVPVVASTTPEVQFGKNDWLVIQETVLAGGNGTFNRDGNCSAVWIEI